MLGNLNILSICGFAITVLLISSVLKNHSKLYYIPILLISCAALLIFILNNSMHIFEKINLIFERSAIPPAYSHALFKSIGICLVAQFTVDACNDAGETSLANKIEFIGKIAILTIALPILEQIIEYSVKIIGG